MKNKRFFKHITEKDTWAESFWNEIHDLLPNRGPKMDMYQENDKIVVIIELPGDVSPEKVKLKLDYASLSIRGEIPYTYPVEPDELIHSERFLGSFQRKIDLPAPVMTDNIFATLQQGVLKIELTKKPFVNEPPVDIEIQDNEKWEEPTDDKDQLGQIDN